MADISKTAAAAAKAVKNAERRSKVDIVLTAEQQIKAARDLRAQKLFVPPAMIDTLLAEYDAAVAAVASLKREIDTLVRISAIAESALTIPAEVR